MDGGLSASYLVQGELLEGLPNLAWVGWLGFNG
jgi:hypothetical protein